LSIAISPGGSCEAQLGNGELPATVEIPAAGAGEIEIGLVARTGETVQWGHLQFLLVARSDVLEATLDDNQLTSIN